jgi:hypothetical protein
LEKKETPFCYHLHVQASIFFLITKSEEKHSGMLFKIYK